MPARSKPIAAVALTVARSTTSDNGTSNVPPPSPPAAAVAVIRNRS
jgi:hypothetical protein